MLRQKQELQSRVMQPLEMTSQMSTSRSATYQWLHKWRRKWTIPSGRFSHRDIPSIDMMRAKPASVSVFDFESKNRGQLVPFSATTLGPKIPPSVMLSRKWGPKNGLKSGPAYINPLEEVAHFRPYFS